MAVMTSADLGKAIQAGLDHIVSPQVKYRSEKAVYKQVFHFSKENKKGYVEDQIFSDLGILTVKPQGSAISFDKAPATFFKRYTFLTYAGGVKVTWEARRDNLYNSQIKKEGPLLAAAEAETREVVAANVLNRAFNASYTGADGKELVATNHPFYKGGTWSNELTIPGSLNPVNLEQAMIDITKWKSESGNILNYKPHKLVFPTDLMFDADRIVNSPMQYNTANHTKNTLASRFPGGLISWAHLTDTKAWFIITDFDERSGLNFIERYAPTIESDSDFGTKDWLYSLMTAYEASWTDPHIIFGSAGA